MSRNQANDVATHVGAGMAPVMSQAMSNPLGVITGFVLLGLVCVAWWLFTEAAEAARGLGPDMFLVPLVAAVLAGHRWMWGPLVRKRTARVVTACVLVVSLVTVEAATGIVGLAFGRVTGFNPREAVMAGGYATPGAVRTLLVNERRRADKGDECRAALASGKMSEGTVVSVIWTANCKDHMTLPEQRAACAKLARTKANAVNPGNTAFCGTIGVHVPSRDGANP